MNEWGPSLVQRTFHACWVHQQIQAMNHELQLTYAIPSAEERLREFRRELYRVLGPPSGILWDHLEPGSPAR